MEWSAAAGGRPSAEWMAQLWRRVAACTHEDAQVAPLRLPSFRKATAAPVTASPVTAAHLRNGPTDLEP